MNCLRGGASVAAAQETYKVTGAAVGAARSKTGFEEGRAPVVAALREVVRLFGVLSRETADDRSRVPDDETPCVDIDVDDLVRGLLGRVGGAVDAVEPAFVRGEVVVVRRGPDGGCDEREGEGRCRCDRDAERLHVCCSLYRGESRWARGRDRETRGWPEERTMFRVKPRSSEDQRRGGKRARLAERVSVWVLDSKDLQQRGGREQQQREWAARPLGDTRAANKHGDASCLCPSLALESFAGYTQYR